MQLSWEIYRQNLISDEFNLYVLAACSLFSENVEYFSELKLCARSVSGVTAGISHLHDDADGL